jgi:hypothetical protein
MRKRRKSIVKAPSFLVLHGVKIVFSIVLAVLLYDPIKNLIVAKSNDVPLLRKWLDLSSVRIEPNSFQFERAHQGRGQWTQKSFKLINSSQRPVYRFRVFVSSSNSSPEDFEISLIKENQDTASNFDPQDPRFCGLFDFKGPGVKGKVLNIYKIEAGKELVFYLRAKPGILVKFDFVDWDPEESGLGINGNDLRSEVYLPSNLAKVTGATSNHKTLFFKY